MRSRVSAFVLALLLGAGCAEEPSEPPALLSAEPDSGSARGGDEVRLSGRDLPAGARAWFGGVEAEVLADEAPDALLVVAPPGVAGSVDLRVEAAGLPLELRDGYRYEPLDPRFVDAPPGYVPDPGPVRDAAAGDVDGDGDVDVVLATSGGGVLLRNTGRGAFEIVPLAPAPPDPPHPPDPSDPPLPADPLPTPAWAGDPRRVLLADLDGDGRLDLFACHGRGEADRLFLGDDGAMRSADDALPTRSSDCRAALATDLDGDGRLDLALLARVRDVEGAVLSHVRVLWNRGAPGAPRFVLDGDLEPPTAHPDEPLADGVPFLSGATGLGLVGSATPASDELRWSGAAPGAILGVAWTPGSALEPVAFEASVDDAPAGAVVLVVAVDAEGERFTTEVVPSASPLRVADLAAGTPDGGDGLLTLPVVEVSLSLRLDGAPPADGAVTLGPVLLETRDGGRVVLADFAHPAAPLAAAPGESSLLAADLNGDGLADFAVARSSGGGPGIRVLLGSADGWRAAEAGRVPAGLDGLPVPALLPLSLDRDDVTDLFVPTAGQDRALRNDGAGWFFDDTLAAAPVDAADGQGAERADLDLDALAELLVANDGAADRLLHPDGAGRLIDWTARAPIALDRSRLILALDVDGDGDLDLLTFGPDRPPRLLVQP